MRAHPVVAGPRSLLLVALAAILGAPGARGQAPALAPAPPEVKQLVDVSPPLLTYNAEGHVAPVRSLVYTPEGLLLSGGTDQVVKVWETLGGPPRLARTIRPPILRAPRGAVYALAVSPTAGPGGERLLAVGGMGMAPGHGRLLLYRIPGAKNLATGEPYKTLPAAQEIRRPESINAVAFDRAGNRLAAGGSDPDILVWDVPSGRAHSRLLGADPSAVNKLAMSADGRRVWAGGSEGVLRRWDVDPSKPVVDVPHPIQPAEQIGSPRQTRALNPPGARDTIVSMSLSPDESTLAVGREDGTVILHEASNLPKSRYLVAPADADAHGPVDALAFDPVAAHRRIALARFATYMKADVPPDLSNLVEVRSLDDGSTRRVATVADVVRDVAFDPTGTTLAYSGGEAQSIYLKDLGQPDALAPVELRGEGSTPRALAISADGRRVGFRRGAGARLEGYDFAGRRAYVPAPGDLPAADAGHALGAYRVRPVDATKLVVEAPGVGGRVELPAIVARYDVRWYSYALFALPGGPPGVVMGTEGMIHVFAPAPGPAGAFPARYLLTRQLRAHSGPVVGLAATADGRRLASSGVDQTIRLWSLRNAATPARLGASFRARADGGAEVDKVDADGFADMAGLRPGDLIVDYQNNAGPKKRDVSAAGIARRDAETPPDETISIRLRRAGTPFNTLARKQDHPLLSLFLTDPGRDGRKPDGSPLAATAEQEWVIWNPDGYYDTSVTADRRFLGWHRNTLKANPSPAELYGGTHYFPIRTFEGLLRRPDVVDRLLAGTPRRDALPRQADGLTPVKVVAEIEGQTPPTVRLAADPPAAGAVALRVELGEGPAEGARLDPARVRVYVDTQQVAVAPPGGWKVGPNAALVPLARPGRIKLTVLAANRAGREQAASVEVDHRPPAPPAAPPKAPELVVVAIGAEAFERDKALGAIRSADLDARLVPETLLASPAIQRYEGTYPPRSPGPTSPVIRAAAGASRAEVEGIFRALAARADSGRLGLPDWCPAPAGRPEAPAPGWDGTPAAGRLGPGDTVVVALSTHVVDANTLAPPGRAGARARPRLVAADTRLDALEATSLDVDALTAPLADLAARGCRVVVILDGHHDDAHGQAAAVREWAHRLDEAQVVVVLASYGLPSLPAPPRRPSPFFNALTRLARGEFRGEVDPALPLTLDIFARELRAAVDDETKSRVEPFINTPTRLGGSATLFAPPPTTTLR